MAWLFLPDLPRTAFDDFERADEAPAVGWNMGTGGFFPQIVSGGLTENGGAAVNALQRGKVDGDFPEFWYGPDQWARTYIRTVSTENGYANGPGPAVRLLTSSGNKSGYTLAVNTTRSTLYRAGNAVFLGEWQGGVDGDVWELQIWGPPASVWLRIIRNGTIIATVRDDQSAIADRPETGLPGIYCFHGVIEKFECGSLARPDVSYFVPSSGFNIGPTAFQAFQSNAFQGQGGYLQNLLRTAFQQNAFQNNAFQIYVKEQGSSFGVLEAAGTLSVSGAADLDAFGKVAATGTLSITGAANLDAYGKVTATGTLAITGTADLEAWGELDATGTVSITGSATMSSLTASDMFCDGTISIVGAGDLKAYGALLVDGTILISGSATLDPIATVAESAGGSGESRYRKRLLDEDELILRVISEYFGITTRL